MSISVSALCSGMCLSQRKAKLKGKIPSKEPLYIIFLSSKWFYVLLVQCLMLLLWWEFFNFFFLTVSITSFKSSELFFWPQYLVDSSTFSVLALTPGKPQHSHHGFYLLSDPAFLGKCNWKVLHTPMISLQGCNSSHANLHLISVKETSNSVIETTLKGFPTDWWYHRKLKK